MKASALVIIGLWIAAVVGYIANIVQLVQNYDHTITIQFAIKLVGILAAPVGSIMGWIGIFS